MAIWKTKKLKKLARILLNRKTEAEMLSFLRDLCTVEELAELSNRWEAAKMIGDGIPYRKIAKETGMSTTTVSRIAHWLNHGEGGYRSALERMRRR